MEKQWTDIKDLEGIIEAVERQAQIFKKHPAASFHAKAFHVHYPMEWCEVLAAEIKRLRDLGTPKS